MAYRISVYCLKNLTKLSSIRNINTKASRLCASVKKTEELSTETHTGQVSSMLKNCYANHFAIFLLLLFHQVYDPTDYRNVRFVNATRQVNPNWGIKLIAEVPPKECTERVVYCDGGDGPLGHPKVYINLVSCERMGRKVSTVLNCNDEFQDKPGTHACGYCGLQFVKKDGHH